MSRSSPTGFVFSTAIEIAAVVVIVSFLPRVDLRPSATAAADTNFARANYAQLPVIEPGVSRPRRSSEAPPLLEANPARSEYVEQRLDRASQQLVNSVGSAVVQTAGNLLTYPPAPSSPVAPMSQTISAPMPPQNLSPPAPTTVRRPVAGSFSTQPRPWLRY